MSRLAFLGPAGTFAEAALLQVAGPDDELVPAATVIAALEQVRGGQVDAAMVPLENSVEGSVSTTLDELSSGEPLQVLREALVPVAFALLVREGTTDVRTVTTHPHAEAQCRLWLHRELPAAQVVPSASTAVAAQLVAAGEYDAAIASPLAAERYGLVALHEGIHDVADAVTRFVLVSRPGPLPEPTGADRTSLVAYISDDHPGALLEVLTELAVRGVNLTRIESRPTGTGLGRYDFSIDCEGHVAEARVGEALSALHRLCADVRFLGSYPRADAAASQVRQHVSDAAYAEAAAWLAALRRTP